MTTAKLDSIQAGYKGMQPTCRAGTGKHQGMAGLRWGQRGKLPRAPRCKGAPCDEMYLFQIKCSCEKFRNSGAIQEYNSILYSYMLR